MFNIELRVAVKHTIFFPLLLNNEITFMQIRRISACCTSMIALLVGGAVSINAVNIY